MTYFNKIQFYSLPAPTLFENKPKEAVPSMPSAKDFVIVDLSGAKTQGFSSLASPASDNKLANVSSNTIVPESVNPESPSSDDVVIDL